jgi:hypothetical protein
VGGWIGKNRAHRQNRAERTEGKHNETLNRNAGKNTLNLSHHRKRGQMESAQFFENRVQFLAETIEHSALF